MAYGQQFSPTQVDKYAVFGTYASASWYTKDALPVYSFTHTLSQYLPSPYAEVVSICPKGDVKQFIAELEATPIIERALWVFCVTEPSNPGVIINQHDGIELFGGPWKLCVNDYAVNPIQPAVLGDKSNPFPKESYMITMKCVDPVWYSMTQEAKVGTFSKGSYKTISDCVSYILDIHGAKNKFIDKTTVSYNWIQSNMTDYEFIRSILAYCNPPGIHFYCNNEKGYFKQIGTGSGDSSEKNSGGDSAGLTIIDIRGAHTDTIVSTINKQFLEKVSEGATVIPYGEGFNESTHEKRDSNPLGGTTSQDAKGKRYIKCSIDNPAIKEAFSANVAFRTRMFGRLVKFRSVLMTSSNPLQKITLQNNNPERWPNLASGEYYIISIKNVIGFNRTWPDVPHSWVVCARGGE